MVSHSVSPGGCLFSEILILLFCHDITFQNRHAMFSHLHICSVYVFSSFLDLIVPILWIQFQIVEDKRRWMNWLEEDFSEGAREQGRGSEGAKEGGREGGVGGREGGREEGREWNYLYLELCFLWWTKVCLVAECAQYFRSPTSPHAMEPCLSIHRMYVLFCFFLSTLFSLFFAFSLFAHLFSFFFFRHCGCLIQLYG